MASRVTRRQMAAAALSVPAALLGQTPPAPAPSISADELSAARDRLRQNGDALAKFDVPIKTEPAVHFKA